MKYFLPYWLARNVTAISDFWPPNVNEGFQKGTQCLYSSKCHPIPRGDCWGAGKEDARSSHPPHLSSLMMNKELRMWAVKKQDSAPGSWGAYERSKFGKPRGLHLPIHRRTLNSLAWYLVFLYYLTIVFDVQTVCPLWYKLVYSLSPSLAYLGQFSQSYWDTASRAHSP